jgi:hypothetical protein
MSIGASAKTSIYRVLAALCIFAMLVGGIGMTIYVLTHRDALGAQSTAPTSELVSSDPSVPTPAEFNIAVDVTARDCPQPDRCVFRYSIQPNYVGKHPLPAQAFSVFYEITGGFEPQPGFFTVSDGQAKIYKDVPVEGPPAAQFRAAVTKVSAVAGPKPVS